jgi:hypothetical protein
MPPPIPDIERALKAVGELLEAEGERIGIVVLGGAALNLLGVVRRATHDVDLVAFGTPPHGTEPASLRRADELPKALAEAASRVARDLGLAPDWLNAAPASQWDTRFPPGMGDRIEWRKYGGLDLGIVHIKDLTFFKLCAAADDVGPDSVHLQDLIALHPSPKELDDAAVWVRSQDPSPAFAQSLDGVLTYVRQRLA